jgi:hypothetical protein
MDPLIPRETKLLRLLLNPSAQLGEIAVGLTKLRESLETRGVNWGDFVDTVINTGLAQKDVPDGSLPPEPSKPDYGLCKIPFGKNKGQLFVDTPPYELRNLRRWILSKPETAVRFADVVHDIEAYLGPQACR